MPERVEVAGRADPEGSRELLRRHVKRRPEAGGLLGRPRGVGHHLGDPEVEDLEPRRAVVARGEEDVLGLEIAVHDARRVRPLERERRLRQEEHDHLRRERPALPEMRAEVLAAEQLHHQEGRPRFGVDARVEGLDDVLALDVRRHPRLELEALAHDLVAQDSRQHHLEGPALPCLEVDALVHRAHPARLEAAHDLVAPLEERPGGERSRGPGGHQRLPRPWHTPIPPLSTEYPKRRQRLNRGDSRRRERIPLPWLGMPPSGASGRLRWKEQAAASRATGRDRRPRPGPPRAGPSAGPGRRCPSRSRWWRRRRGSGNGSPTRPRTAASAPR